MKIYVSGRISNGEELDELIVTENLKVGSIVSIQLQERGHRVLSPFLASPFWVEAGYDYEMMMAISYLMILESDGIYMIPDWSLSNGAKREHTFAKEMGIPIFYSLDEI